jgi:hypothetical protein
MLNGFKSSAAGISAIVSASAALSCCLPLGFLAALGLTGTSFFLHSFQPWLLGLSVLFLGIGFFQHYKGERCNAKRNRFVELVLWGSAFFVLVMIFFPEIIAGLMANVMRWGRR